MSNALAIAAVTRSLRSLINRAVQAPPPSSLPDDVRYSNQVEVTILPLDKAGASTSSSNRVNLYLYHTTYNAAFRNMDMPHTGRAISVGQPPLALNLYYLITAYCEDEKELISQFLLGQAMQVLHDHAILTPDEIADALAASELQNQVEHVRLTPQPLSLEELSKLWTTFQTQYRHSVAYEASVVLIESNKVKKSALPVRIASVYGSTFRRPVIQEITPQVATVGEKIKLKGLNLKGVANRLRIGSTLVQPDAVNDMVLEVTLPTDLQAGVNTVQIIQELNLGMPETPHPSAGVESNEAAFMVAPKITSMPPFNASGNDSFTLSVLPAVKREQKILLLIGDQPIELIAPESNAPSASESISFKMPANLPTGQFLMRVRVDGAESALEVDSDSNSPTYNQYVGPMVTIS